MLGSFHPEMVLLLIICVNLRPCLCLPVPARQTGDVLPYVSAQALDFLDLEQNPSFPIWKLRSAHPVFPDGNCKKPVITKVQRVNSGIRFEGFNIRKNAVQKVTSRTFRPAFVKLKAFHEVFFGFVKDIYFHSIDFLILALTLSKDENTAFPSRTRFSLADRTS
jgi:hypothetical protein